MYYQLDRINRKEGELKQLYLFIGNENDIDKSYIISTIAKLFIRIGQSYCLLIITTFKTATANINGIIIHSIYKFSKDTILCGNRYIDIDGFKVSRSIYIDGRIKID